MSAIEAIPEFPGDSGFKLDDDDVADLVSSPQGLDALGDDLDVRAVSQGPGERSDELDPFGSIAADHGSGRNMITTESFDKFLEEGIATDFEQPSKEVLLQPITAEPASVEHVPKKDDVADIFDSLCGFDRFYGIEDDEPQVSQPAKQDVFAGEADLQ